jgi:hypothetical protein
MVGEAVDAGEPAVQAERLHITRTNDAIAERVLKEWRTCPAWTRKLMLSKTVRH